MYPDFREITKYTGPVRAYNFELYRESMQRKGQLSQAENFRLATGKKLVLMYKWQIESFLRTRSYAGFQLLGMQDFPGQGSALVGVLDAFWDSKELISAAEFRSFCGPTVPLMRFDKMVWKSSETFSAGAQVYHYGKADLPYTRAKWSLRKASGEQLIEGVFERMDILAGGLNDLGELDFSLSGIEAPAELILTLHLEGTAFHNKWKIWVYPDSNNEESDDLFSGDTEIVYQWDAKTKKMLASGQNVLLISRGEMQNEIDARWSQVLWNIILFQRQPSTFGIFCDPGHPVFAKFPTASFADWQWFDILNRSKALNLDKFQVDFKPLVQFIDDYHPQYNRLLSGIFEARVGNGKLVVSNLDLSGDLSQRPAALQLKRSLLAYMSSEAFLPVVKVSEDALDEILVHLPNKENLNDVDELLKRAILHVIPSGNPNGIREDSAWTFTGDAVLAILPGVSYSLVDAMACRREGTSAWSGKEFQIIVDYPENFKGKLLVQFSDPDQQLRDAKLFFDGKDQFEIGHHKEGTWVSFDLDHPRQGSLRIQYISGPDILVTGMAIIPARE